MGQAVSGSIRQYLSVSNSKRSYRMAREVSHISKQEKQSIILTRGRVVGWRLVKSHFTSPLDFQLESGQSQSVRVKCGKNQK